MGFSKSGSRRKTTNDLSLSRFGQSALAEATNTSYKLSYQLATKLSGSLGRERRTSNPAMALPQVPYPRLEPQPSAVQQAVALAQVVQFYRGLPEELQHASTLTLVEQVLKPATAPAHCAYIQTIPEATAARPPTHIVVHSWNAPFSETLWTLLDYLEFPSDFIASALFQPSAVEHGPSDQPLNMRSRKLTRGSSLRLYDQPELLELLENTFVFIDVVCVDLHSGAMGITQAWQQSIAGSADQPAAAMPRAIVCLDSACQVFKDLRVLYTLWHMDHAGVPLVVAAPRDRDRGSWLSCTAAGFLYVGTAAQCEQDEQLCKAILDEFDAFGGVASAAQDVSHAVLEGIRAAAACKQAAVLERRCTRAHMVQTCMMHGELLLATGAWAEAEQQLDETLHSTVLQKYGLYSMQNEQLLRMRATALAGQGRWLEAEVLARQALEALEGMSQVMNKPHSLPALSCLLNILQQLGQYREAEDLWRDAYHMHDLQLGPTHPSTVEAIASLAHNLGTYQARYSEAELLLSECLKSSKQQGRKVRCAELYADLAECVRRLPAKGGDRAAQAYYSQAVEMMEAECTAEHPASSALRCRRAAHWALCRCYSQARSALEQEVELLSWLLGPLHSQMLAAQEQLASVLQVLGHVQAAEDMYCTVMQKRRAVASRPNALVGSTLMQLGQCLWQQGRWVDAAKAVQEAITQLQPALGCHHPKVMMAYLTLAEVMEHQSIERSRVLLVCKSLNESAESVSLRAAAAALPARCSAEGISAGRGSGGAGSQSSSDDGSEAELRPDNVHVVEKAAAAVGSAAFSDAGAGSVKQERAVPSAAAAAPGAPTVPRSAIAAKASYEERDLLGAEKAYSQAAEISMHINGSRHRTTKYIYRCLANNYIGQGRLGHAEALQKMYRLGNLQAV